MGGGGGGVVGGGGVGGGWGGGGGGGAAPVGDFSGTPLHPYTAGLLRSLPKLKLSGERGHRVRLQEIPGIVPALNRLPKGCSFNPRCDKVMDKCHQIEPELREVKPGHFVRCLLHE